MSWLFYPLTRSEKEEIKSLWNSERDGVKHEMLAARKVGGAWYCAVKVTGGAMFKDSHATNFIHAADGSYVFAAVILTKREGGKWGYNDMSEIMGPCYYDAPASIMALLSPINPEGVNAKYATEWRATVAQKAAIDALTVGQTIRLAKAATFRKVEEDTFTVSFYKTRTGQTKRAFYSPKVGLVRLSGHWLADAVVVA